MVILSKGVPVAQLVKNLGRRPWFDSWVRKICKRRDSLPTPVFLGFPGGSAGKQSHLQCGRPGFDPWVGKIPWRRERLPTPVFWPGEFHGLYSPWGRKELDTTEKLPLSLYSIVDVMCLSWTHFESSVTPHIVGPSEFRTCRAT